MSEAFRQSQLLLSQSEEHQRILHLLEMCSCTTSAATSQRQISTDLHEPAHSEHEKQLKMQIINLEHQLEAQKQSEALVRKAAEAIVTEQADLIKVCDKCFEMYCCSLFY